jgi:DNA-directed RNA polymerase subunit N (RpoN/RPB10)
MLSHAQDTVILQTHSDNRSPSIYPLRLGIPTGPAGVYKLSSTSRVIRSSVLNKYCTRERKMLQLTANKHSGIKYIKNHILSTCCGQLLHRMSPSLLLLSSSSGIFSSFYVLIHVFCRFEIPPVRCFWQRQVIGGKFVEVGQNKKERSRITSDIPTYFYVSHFCCKSLLSYQVLFTSLRLGIPTASACVYKLITATSST